MKQNYVDSIIKAAQQVISTMCAVEPVVGTPELKDWKGTWGEVTGIIGLEGEESSGKLLLSFNNDCLLDLASRVLLEEQDKVDQHVLDLVGELTNILTGVAKSKLELQGLSIGMDTPRVVTGKGELADTSQGTEVLTIPFQTPAGNFVVETTLKRTL